MAETKVPLGLKDKDMKELTQEELIQWKRVITDVLREFHEICHKHGLTYYAVGGTAIGAVRHKGIIPWDDDIDVAMPRPDFDKFVDLCRASDLGGYELVDASNTQGYNLSFPKFCNKNTTLVERWDTPCVIGLFIDIFPLDGAPEDTEVTKVLVEKYRKLRNRYEAISTHNTFGEYIALLTKPKEWGRFVVKTLGFFFRKQMGKRFLSQMEAISRTVPFGETSKVINYGGAYGIREMFNISLLKGETVTLPFENIEIDMMPEYDTYLRGVYGDYMQLPPEDKRIPHHLKAFYDLKARVKVNFERG